MKKRDLLFLGLVVAAMPVVAQRPASTPQDAKVIFTQNFEPEDESLSAEEAWQQWQSQVWDTIYELNYYKRASTGNINPSQDINIYDGSEDWEIGYVRTDSIIPLRNGVVITDANVADWPEDYAKIVTDESVSRIETFGKYGEDGGKYVFRYVSGLPKIASSQYGEYYNGISAAYRRNLFIRGLDIEDNTSYRVTFFIKAKAQGTTKPTFYLNVMRGYFNSECDFSMGYIDNSSSSHPYEYSTAFNLTKDDFNGDWEKVTFMTHYLTDSISNAYIFTKNGYWWSGRWPFTAPDGTSYDYIQQPDKFFMRLSFASDSTTFEVDNIAITKSTIGGVEHTDNMIRVNFGYDTNLKTLADEAYKTTGIGSVELPGDYFSVYGHYPGKDWYPIAINSAEYHDDGYMYMWSKDAAKGIKNRFDSYDSVLVSFINPVDDPSLCLKYNGSKFPYALDVDWIKDGKKLRGFSNELSVPNPYIVKNQFGRTVYSMKNLPPVLKEPEYEKGSFALPQSINSMTFSFSREVKFDDQKDVSELALLKVEKAGVVEFWVPSKAQADCDSIITFTRQQKDINKNGVLEGDYTFSLVGIQGEGTDYAEPVTIDYSFGPTVMATEVASLTFDSYDEGAGYTLDVASLGISGLSGFNCAAKVTSFTGAYTKALMWGLYGQNTGASNSKENCCKLFYTFDAPSDGTYAISVGMTGCNKSSWNDDANMTVFIYDSENKEVATFAYGGTGFKPAEGGQVNEVMEYIISANLKAGNYKIAFTLPNEGSWGGGHKGGKILYYINLKSDFTLGYSYVNRLNNSIASLNGVLEIAAANADAYTGDVYDASKGVYEGYLSFSDTKPSAYDKVIGELNDAKTKVNDRIALVDALTKENNIAIDTLAAFEDLTDYQELVAYKDLAALSAEVDALICKDMTDDSIKAYSTKVQDAVKALNNRMTLIANFEKQLATTKALIDAAKFSETDVYSAMRAAYEANENTNKVTSTDDELTTATQAVAAGQLGYDSYVAGVQSSTVRINSLIDAAEELEVVIAADHAADVQARVDNLISDDDDLAEIYKSAIKVALLDKLAKGEAVDEIDMSGFIKNFNLYTAATLEDDLNKFYYQWGTPNDRWRMKYNYTSETAFPGWITVSGNGGNFHIGSEAIQWDQPKAPVFDAYIATDWSTSMSMTQELVDRPAGIYALGAGMTIDQSAGTGNAILSAILPDSTYTVGVSGGTTSNPPAAANTFIEDITVDGTAAPVIKVEVKSSNSWTRIDNFTLTFTGKIDGHDYAADLEAEKANLNTLLSFVYGAEAKAASVSYYGIDGIKVDAPKAGSITIKVTELGNGKRLIQKVLVK